MTTTSDFALALADLTAGTVPLPTGDGAAVPLIEIMPVRPEVAATGNALPVLPGVPVTALTAVPAIDPAIPPQVTPALPQPDSAILMAPIATVLATMVPTVQQTIADASTSDTMATALPMPDVAPTTNAGAPAASAPIILPRSVATAVVIADQTTPEMPPALVDTKTVPDVPVKTAPRRAKTVSLGAPVLPAEPQIIVADVASSKDTSDLSDAPPRKGKKPEAVASVEVAPLPASPMMAIEPMTAPVVVSATVSAIPVLPTADTPTIPAEVALVVPAVSTAPAVPTVAAAATPATAMPVAQGTLAPVRRTATNDPASVAPDGHASPPPVVAATQPPPVAAPALRDSISAVAARPVDPLPTEVKAALAQAIATPAPTVAPSVDVVIEAARPVAKPDVVTVALPTAAPTPKPADVLPAAQAFAQAMFAPQQATTNSDDSDADPLPVSAVPGTGHATTTGPAPVAVAATAAADRNALDMSRGDWMMSMIDKIETLRDESGAGGETRLKLSPDALGNVDVTVRRDDSGQYQVRITADTVQARTILADAAPRLNDMAEARGLKLSQAGVDTGTGANPGFADSNRRNEQQTATAPRRPASAFTDSGAEGDPTIQDTRIA